LVADGNFKDFFPERGGRIKAQELLAQSTSGSPTLSQGLPYTKAQQNVAGLHPENTSVEKQIAELHEKNRDLRNVVESLQANTALLPEEQQEIPVPEAIMQEMEHGLAALGRGPREGRFWLR
jgi:hypothetical protein